MMTSLQILKAIDQLREEQSEMEGEEMTLDDIWAEYSFYSLDEKSMLAVDSQGGVMAYRLDWNAGTWYDPEDLVRHALESEAKK